MEVLIVLQHLTLDDLQWSKQLTLICIGISQHSLTQTCSNFDGTLLGDILIQRQVLRWVTLTPIVQGHGGKRAHILETVHGSHKVIIRGGGIMF